MSNANSMRRKKILREQKICYICEVNTPLPDVDEFGGKSCRACRESLLSMRVTYALEAGYKRAH